MQFKSSALVSLVALSLVTATQADVTAFNPFGNLAAAGTGNDGLFFTVGANNLLVTSLGEFNGTDMSHHVAIFAASGGNSTGAELVSADVTTNSSLTGWSYVDVSSSAVELLANTQYVIIAFSAGGQQYTASAANSGLGAGIASFDGYKYNESGSFDANMTSAYEPSYFGPNFQYSEVPAPGALALLGLAGAIGGRRRRS